MPGTLFVVATPIGNLEDVTARALRVLREVTLIAAEDTRRTSHLLTRYAISTPTTSLHEHNERKKMAVLVERLQRGDDIALVSDAGTPGISDPGQQLVAAAIDAGIRIEPIPGPSALVTVLMASGLPVETFTFLGFPPTRITARKAWFESLRTAKRTVVFFEAPHRIRATLELAMNTVGDCRAVIGRELTKTHEELVRGPISKLIAQLCEPRGEYTVVLEVGQSPEIDAVKVISDDQLLSEFTILREMTGSRRRQAITALAQKYGQLPNEVYDAIERAKKSGK